MKLWGCFVAAGSEVLVKIDGIVISVKDQEVRTWP